MIRPRSGEANAWLVILTLCLVVEGAARLFAEERSVDDGVSAAFVRPPAALSLEGVPDISATLEEDLKRYQDVRTAAFVGWQPDGSGMLVTTRPEALFQLHTIERPGAAPEQLTHGDEPASWGRYLPDGTLLFSRAAGGNERYQVFRRGAGGEDVRLTDGVSRNLLGRVHPDGRRVLVASTQRNKRDTDLYLYDAYGETEPRRILEVDRESWHLNDWSPDGKSALLSRFVSVNESYGMILDLATGERLPLPHESGSGHQEAGQGVSRGSFRFGGDSETIYFVSDARGEFRELARLDRQSGRTTWWSEGIPWDVGSLDVTRARDRAVFVTNEDGFSRLYLLENLNDATPRRRPLELPEGIIRGARFSPDGQRLGLTFGGPTAPYEAYSYELEGGRLERWTYSERAGFEESGFVPAKLVRLKSFDQRIVPAFVFLPRTASSAGDGSERKPLPVLISIHGGPESQYRPAFSSLRQFYCNELGLAVVAPNVRGSVGYGKTYSRLDNGMLREDSVRDIGSVLDWIAGPEGQALGLDGERVAVTGGSYGGYMVLASLIHFGERLRGGIDSVGISDFRTFLENTSSYRVHLRRAEYGDEREPEMRAFFEKISPLRRIGALRSPLFVIHGENDPRVPFSEARQLVERARATGQPVWTLYANNEGHGFRRLENRDFQQMATALFLKRFLVGEEEAESGD